MKNIYVIAFTILLATLTGCASTVQPQVEINNNFWQEKDKSIGIIMSEIPKPETTIVGASCLLCYAVASGANSSLDKHLKTISTEDVDALKIKVLNFFTEKEMNVSLLPEVIKVDKLKKFKSKELNVAKKDYSAFKKRDLDYLLVIDVRLLGAHRSYSGYIPTTDPLSVYSGTAYLVDLNTNKYAWYHDFDNKIPADLEWDEPPTFPGLTNSLYQVISLGNESVLSALSNPPATNLPTNHAAINAGIK